MTSSLGVYFTELLLSGSRSHDEVKPRASHVEVERGRMEADGGGHEGESRN